MKLSIKKARLPRHPSSLLIRLLFASSKILLTSTPSSVYLHLNSGINRWLFSKNRTFLPLSLHWTSGKASFGQDQSPTQDMSTSSVCLCLWSPQKQSRRIRWISNEYAEELGWWNRSPGFSGVSESRLWKRSIGRSIGSPPPEDLHLWWSSGANWSQLIKKLLSKQKRSSHINRQSLTFGLPVRISSNPCWKPQRFAHSLSSLEVRLHASQVLLHLLWAGLIPNQDSKWEECRKRTYLSLGKNWKECCLLQKCRNCQIYWDQHHRTSTYACSRTQIQEGEH